MSNERPENLPELPDEDGAFSDETRAVESTRGIERPVDGPRTPPQQPGPRQPYPRNVPPPQQPPPQRNLAPRPQGQQAVRGNRPQQMPPGNRPPYPQPGGRPPARPPRPGSARSRRDSGLYLPLWSILLMLAVVIVIAGGLVLLVLSLGGDNRNQVVNSQGTVIPPTQPPPVLIVSSPIPTVRPDSFAESPATPTLPAQFDPNINSGILQAPPNFQLQGPTLPPIAISPTPVPMGVGVQIEVIDVGDQQLNVRNEAGIFGTEILFRADEGERFRVIGGPVQQDNFTWWQIQDAANAARTGWAASQYLLGVPG